VCVCVCGVCNARVCVSARARMVCTHEFHTNMSENFAQEQTAAVAERASARRVPVSVLLVRIFISSILCASEVWLYSVY
jgi:hypothetical protein